MDLNRYFNNKVVWITGASSGIGKALAFRCAELGARLIISARRAHILQELKKEVSSFNKTVHILPFDLMEMGEFHLRVKEAIEAYGQIDLFIGNAGLSIRSLTKDLDFEVVDRVLKVNYLSTVNLVLQILRGMIERQAGHITVLSSPAGIMGTPYRSAYCAAKHALHGFFESFAAESWRDNIDVTIIVPGWVRTNMPLNALEGDGTPHGILDPGHVKANEPAFYVDKILRAISKRKVEYHVALDWKIRLGYFLKRFFPRFLRAGMKKIDVT